MMRTLTAILHFDITLIAYWHDHARVAQLSVQTDRRNATLSEIYRQIDNALPPGNMTAAPDHRDMFSGRILIGVPTHVSQRTVRSFTGIFEARIFSPNDGYLPNTVLITGIGGSNTEQLIDDLFEDIHGCAAWPANTTSPTAAAVAARVLQSRALRRGLHKQYLNSGDLRKRYIQRLPGICHAHYLHGNL